MPATQIEQIRDQHLRALIERAEQELNDDRNLECVRTCAEAYLELLRRHPDVLTALKKVMQAPRVKAGLTNGTLRFAPLMFPRLAAKLQLPEDGDPSITFDREHIGFAEAIQYYEFLLGLITDAEKGELNIGPSGPSL